MKNEQQLQAFDSMCQQGLWLVLRNLESWKNLCRCHIANQWMQLDWMENWSTGLVTMSKARFCLALPHANTGTAVCWSCQCCICHQLMQIYHQYCYLLLSCLFTENPCSTNAWPWDNNRICLISDQTQAKYLQPTIVSWNSMLILSPGMKKKTSALLFSNNFVNILCVFLNVICIICMESMLVNQNLTFIKVFSLSLL